MEEAEKKDSLRLFFKSVIEMKTQRDWESLSKLSAARLSSNWQFEIGNRQ
jgi:hypothetical protein